MLMENDPTMPRTPELRRAGAYLVLDELGLEADPCRTSGPRAVAVGRILEIEEPEDQPPHV
jgi:hypothetical protein